MIIDPTKKAIETIDLLKHGKIAYVIFHIARGSIEVEIEKNKCDFDAPHVRNFRDDMVKSGQPRYGLIHWNNQTVLYSYIPDTAKIREKMLYASQRESFHAHCRESDGIQLVYQPNPGNDADQFSVANTENFLLENLGYDTFYEKKLWNIERVIWIGFYKNTQNSNNQSFIATLSKDLVKHILLFVSSKDDWYPRYTRYRVVQKD